MGLFDLSFQGKLFEPGYDFPDIGIEAMCRSCPEQYSTDQRRRYALEFSPAAQAMLMKIIDLDPLTIQSLEIVWNHFIWVDLGSLETYARSSRSSVHDRELSPYVASAKKMYLWYDIYKTTDWWKDLKKRCLIDSKWNCNACGHIGSEDNCLCMHHKNPGVYLNRLGRERVGKDVGILCWNCHGCFHQYTYLAVPREPPAGAVEVLEREGHTWQ